MPCITIFSVGFYYTQMSISTVAIVDQPPVANLVDEIAGVFGKWMQSDSVDDQRGILFRVQLVSHFIFMTNWQKTSPVVGEEFEINSKNKKFPLTQAAANKAASAIAS